MSTRPIRSVPLLIPMLGAVVALSACASADSASLRDDASSAPAQTQTAAGAPAATADGAPVVVLQKKASAEDLQMPARDASESVRGSPAASDYVERADVQDFLKAISIEKGIPLEWLAGEVALARYSPLSERYTTPRPNANKKTTAEKNFLLYERNIVNAERIERGAAFVREHAADFDRIESRTGVSRYAVAAIIGVESIYGRNMGRFRVLDALMTLSFDYTRRAKYYRSELAGFLEFCWQQQIPPVSVTGSFAGAMGLGQFMPSSLRAYGMDGDDDGRIDIVNSPADGIASVAHYLEVHGWVRGAKPLYRVEATPEIFRKTGSGGIRTHSTKGCLLEAGVRPLEDIPFGDAQPALLVDLPWIRSNDERGVDYYLGTGSFAAILRYNRSYFYAAAVSLLADRIEARVTALDKAEETAGEKTEAEAGEAAPAVAPQSAPAAAEKASGTGA